MAKKRYQCTSKMVLAGTKPVIFGGTTVVNIPTQVLSKIDTIENPIEMDNPAEVRAKYGYQDGFRRFSGMQTQIQCNVFFARG